MIVYVFVSSIGIYLYWSESKWPVIGESVQASVEGGDCICMYFLNLYLLLVFKWPVIGESVQASVEGGGVLAADALYAPVNFVV